MDEIGFKTAVDNAICLYAPDGPLTKFVPLPDFKLYWTFRGVTVRVVRDAANPLGDFRVERFTELSVSFGVSPTPPIRISLDENGVQGSRSSNCFVPTNDKRYAGRTTTRG
jgi:hypothetical protein